MAIAPTLGCHEPMVQLPSEIIVPGSTSNLGAAFDALSVAVDLSLRVRILEVRPAAAGALEMTFAGTQPSGENRIETAFRRAVAKFGDARSIVRAQVSSEIPMAAGLGSSAAAAVAGLRLYEVASGRSLTTGEILAVATELEGHPDNASASLLGGITVSCQCDDGRIIARAWNWPADIRFVVATPEFALPTHEARGVLPTSVSLADAIANLQRALLLVRALETGDYDDIREALKDRWHQPARTALVPGLEQALAIDHPAILGVCLSGAGPSVAALAAPGRSEEAAALLSEVYRAIDVPHTMRNLAAYPLTSQRLPIPAA